MSGALPQAPAQAGIHPGSRALHAAHPVRKTRAQKAAFRADATALLKGLGWPVATEEAGGLVKSRNLVAGDVAGARIIFAAHYDTPARMPFPNFIAPRNLAVSLAYQLLVVVVFFSAAFLISFGLRRLGAPPLAAMYTALAVLLVFLVMLLAGPANKHNANDNTSGTLAVLEIARALPQAARAGVALVLFDNEELGLLGSAAFARRNGGLGKKLLLNFDCVGEGDTFLFVLPKALRKDEALLKDLAAAFPEAGGKKALLDRSPLTFYPSDQMNFKRGIGVAALRRAPVVGLYLSRLHTGRDRVLQEENLAWLCEGVCRLAGPAGAPGPKERPAPAVAPGPQ